MNLNQFFKTGSIISLNKDELLIGYGPREWLPQPGTFYFPDFFLESTTPWCTHENTLVISKELFTQQLLDYHKEISLPTWIPPKSEPFFEAFQEVKSGRLEKVVPYAMTTTTSLMTAQRLCHSLLHALANSSHHTLYGYWNEQNGILGITPETLFKLRENHLETMALAGTSKTTHFSQTNEHELVVKGIVESLQPFGKVKIGEKTTISFSTLYHLLTPISLELHTQVDIHQLIKILHPTPALGTYPKESQWLKYYQTRVPRKHFGAPFAYCYRNEMHCIVAIRNIQWSNIGIAIAAGCGIVAKSNPENEWNELLLKTQAIQQMLGLSTNTLPEKLFNLLSTVE